MKNESEFMNILDLILAIDTVFYIFYRTQSCDRQADYTIDTIDYVQGIENGPINPLHPCPKPNTFST